MTTARRRLWGWYAFDWASQPYSTLLLTFVFGPYVTEVLGDGSAAQAAWGYGVGAAGVAIALLAPFLGAMADKGRGRMGWIVLFSCLYVAGALAPWFAMPEGFPLVAVLALFALGIVGLEFTTIFTNAMLPGLGARRELGRISGTGTAIGYLGGLVALVAVLALFAEGDGGTTLLGLAPALGLDPEAREGTRFVGPFTAIWFVLFMIPFFLWVREPPRPDALPLGAAARAALPELRATLVALPQRPSLAAFLGASMFYRDALNGFYVFGGLYAAGVLGWSITQIGIFGIFGIVAAAFFAWIGGRLDSRHGPKPVIVGCTALLTALAVATVFIGRERLFGMPVPPDSIAPDVAFYIVGAAIGSAGGALQAASRTMMVRQGEEAKMTEAFGLYALAGKFTAFLAPLLVGVATDLSGSQQAGIVPLVALFLVGLVLLRWVHPEGEPALRASPQFER